jgi:hypothetical protein
MARIKIVPMKNRDVNKTPIKNTNKKKVVKKKTIKNPSKKDQVAPKNNHKTKTKRKPKITKKTVILPVDENYNTLSFDINNPVTAYINGETQNWRTIALKSLEKNEELKKEIELLKSSLNNDCESSLYWIGPYGVLVSSSISEVVGSDGISLITKDGKINDLNPCPMHGGKMTKKRYIERYTIKGNNNGHYFYIGKL